MKHTVTVEKIIASGKGLTRTAEGQVVMIPFTLSGEKLLINQEKKKSGYIEGSIDRILSPSPARITAPCPLYGVCGGCDLQHGSYPEQLSIKKEIIRESLLRAKIPLTSQQLDNPLASPVQWGYRYRLRLKINPSGQLGYFKKKSNTFLLITECLVASQGLCSAVVELNKSGILQPLAKICSEIELLESPADGKITLVFRGNKRKTLPPALLQKLTTLSIMQEVQQIGWFTRKGFHTLFPSAKPLTQQISLKRNRQNCSLSWSGGCFSQVNPAQNEQLIRLVCDFSGDLSGKTVLDLYCGMGNFSVPLGCCGGTLTGIEGNQESILWAEKNARKAGISARFFVADVRTALQQLVDQGETTDIILLDPPRSGVGKNIALLPHLKPKKIIYVSCDPATLARDLHLLCSQGYRITRVVPVDMFPQTSHIESVVLLER
ncbi:class I SAM-dependent RNA methyltransferase [Desulfobulbus sp. TB]|nr:class I SAM-dependent RNA methyltransferase [Desulfobulbus sp. TB]